MRRAPRMPALLGRLPVALTLALGLVACGGDAPGTEGGTTAGSGHAAGAAPSQAAPTDGAQGGQELAFKGDPSLAALETMPTQDELDARVAETIDASNADAAFETLRAAIENDQDVR